MGFPGFTRRRLAILAGTIFAGAGGVWFARRPPPRVGVLTPRGEGEFTLMDFSRPFPLDPPPAGWWHRKFWTRAPMLMSFAVKDGVGALRMETKASASMLFRFVDVAIADWPVLRWRWFIERPIVTPLDERTREGDDHPARLFLTLATGKGERRAFEIIWGNRLRRGETKYIGTFPHYVADGGDANVGTWRDEEVDLAAVTKMFWPDGETARLTEIGLFCDSDDTGTSSIAWAADLRVARR